MISRVKAYKFACPFCPEIIYKEELKRVRDLAHLHYSGIHSICGAWLDTLMSDEVKPEDPEPYLVCTRQHLADDIGK